MLKGIIGGAGCVECGLEHCHTSMPLLEFIGLSLWAAQDMVVYVGAEAASGTNEGLGLPGLIRNRMS